jgi:glutamyl-tRNA synthetase
MINSPVGRLAPSPTGAQHVGNARTYLLAWLSIRSRGGRVCLRIEDIDSPRIKPGADQLAVDDLRWLGLDWDEGPDVGGPHAPYVQTERLALYDEALAALRAAERVYPCTCSRADVLSAASAPHIGQEGPKYSGRCAQNTAASAAGLTAKYCWRFRASSRLWQFDDAVAGPCAAHVANELGDFVVAKTDGTPAYQLAVVIDDHAMGITEVVRGNDLLPSTFRQLELYDFFGWQPPGFAHVPLVIGPDGRRLAKRHGDTRLLALRQAGVAPEKLIGLLAHSCGLRDSPAPITARELLADFDWSRLPRQPLVFTDEMWRRLFTS